MLVGLTSKSQVLIVEFAEQLRERGLPIVEAAGHGGRHSVGTTVFGGMIASTPLNLYFIPVLYVLIEEIRERSGVKVVGS